MSNHERLPRFLRLVNCIMETFLRRQESSEGMGGCHSPWYPLLTQGRLECPDISGQPIPKRTFFPVLFALWGWCAGVFAAGCKPEYNGVVDRQDIGADVLALKKGLGELPEPVARPVFVIVSGLPGTGKSYFSRKLAERLPSVIVESDAMRKILFLSPTYSVRESQRLFSALHSLVEELLGGGITVILDATNLVEQHRERLYRIARRLSVKLMVVQVEAPRELVYQRLQNRLRAVDYADNSDADWDVYRKMKASAQRIRCNYFAVDTSRDIEPFMEKIVREAKR